MFVESDRPVLVAHLKQLKKRVCGYGQAYGDCCDCKYGEPGQGEATGCAELTMVIAGIEKLTEKQWQRFLGGWGRRLE